MISTSDPNIVIEEQREGYVRYRHANGRRWEVHGVCNRRGDCLIGAVLETDNGDVEVRDHAHIEQLKVELGRERIDSEMDVPVTPEFRSCCGADIFTFVELDPGDETWQP